MLHLVKTLVHYCRIRDLAWDPRKDILFLCQHYGEEVQPLRNQLDQKAVQQNFLGTPYFSRLSPEVQRRCYQVLLGTAPPPTMAITPPPPISGHKYSASASDIAARPPMAAHNSTPSLVTQHTPELLSPPLPGKPKASQQRAAVGERPSELPASASISSKYTSELATAAAKDSRSRYRPISAPDAREANSIAPHIAGPQTRHLRQSSQPPIISSHKLPFATMQQSLPYQLQSPSYLAPVPMASQGRGSLPNLNPETTSADPPFAFSQTHLLNGMAPYSLPQSSNLRPLMELSATPVPMNPGQQHMKSQLGMSGAHPLRQHPVNNFPITERPMPPQARVSQTQQPMRVELSATPIPETRANESEIIKRDEERDFSSPPRPQELPSQTHLPELAGLSLAWNSSHRYPKSLPAKDEVVDPILPAPVELDAMCQLSQFIAELSVERNTPAPAQLYEQQLHQRLPSQNQSPSNARTHSAPCIDLSLQDSPVSPPDSEVSLEVSQIEHPDTIVRPLKPRTQSTPLAALPASLMAGGLATHQRSPSNNNAIQPTTAPMQKDFPNTNASRYGRYYASATPPSSAPNSSRGSPQPPPASAYKAYQPPLMSLSPSSLPLSPPKLPFSPPEVPQSPPEPRRPTSFTSLKDVDGASGYFKSHRRDASNDSSRSHDSSRLAQEYQAELPKYGEGYGSPGRS